MKYAYQKVEYENLLVNHGSDGNKLSLCGVVRQENGEDILGKVEFDHGFFAHAYSILGFENLSSSKFTYFETYTGVNKTARVQNTQTSLTFQIYFDNKLVFQSE